MQCNTVPAEHHATLFLTVLHVVSSVGVMASIQGATPQPRSVGRALPIRAADVPPFPPQMELDQHRELAKPQRKACHESRHSVAPESTHGAPGYCPGSQPAAVFEPASGRRDGHSVTCQTESCRHHVTARRTAGTTPPSPAQMAPSTASQHKTAAAAPTERVNSAHAAGEITPGRQKYLGLEQLSQL